MSLTWAPGVAMSKEEIDNFLRQKLVARLTSIRPDGYPHTTPLWYVWDGEVLWFILGAGERPRQHIRNLRRNPKLCVIIDRDVRPEQGGLFDAQGVGIRGTVELSTDETLQEEIARRLVRKYMGEEGDQYIDGLLQDGKPEKNRVIAKIKPENLFAWDFRKLEGAGGYSTA
jgi:PPOX class probable F420-dependent enzyme